MKLLLLKRKAIIIMFKSKVLIVWSMIKQNLKKENIFVWNVYKSGTFENIFVWNVYKSGTFLKR